MSTATSPDGIERGPTVGLGIVAGSCHDYQIACGPGSSATQRGGWGSGLDAALDGAAVTFASASRGERALRAAEPSRFVDECLSRADHRA